MRHAARDEVAHVIEEQPGRLRRAGANTVLAVLAASALSPVAVEVFGGGSVVGAIANLAGGVGSGYLTTLVTNVATRLRGTGDDLAEARELLAAELQTALEKGDGTADELRESLAALLNEVGGWEAAADELRVHLLSCFEELDARADQRAAEQLRQGRHIAAAQHRQTRRLDRQGHQLQEIVDRLRLLTREARTDTAPPPPPAITPVVVPPAVRPPEHVTWTGGTEVKVGDQVYLLHDVLLAERAEPDGTVSRQARALRLVPSTGRDRHVWLRQVHSRPDVPGSRRALQALDRERRLLSRLGTPHVAQYVKNGPTATLALSWPASLTHAPDELLAPSDPPTVFSLLGGLAGLGDTLTRLHALGATHRFITPDRIVVRDDGRLTFLDLGLAGHDPAPGEGPADYQAPEQRRRGAARPGPHTDVYQLAAVAYHLLTGHPPHPRTPLPVRGQAPELPAPADAAIDTALSAEAGSRPAIRSLGAALRAARDRL